MKSTLVLPALVALAFTFAPHDVHARAWDKARFEKCIKVELGDDLSNRQQLTTIDCRPESIASASSSELRGLSVDGLFIEVRQKGESQWNPVLVLMGTFDRLRSAVISDTGYHAAITKLNARLADRVVELEPARSESRLGHCMSPRGGLGIVAGVCTYMTVAMFPLDEETAASIKADWNVNPDAALEFRAFLDDGSQFDGAMPAAEFVAVEDYARSVP